MIICIGSDTRTCCINNIEGGIACYSHDTIDCVSSNGLTYMSRGLGIPSSELRQVCKRGNIYVESPRKWWVGFPVGFLRVIGRGVKIEGAKQFTIKVSSDEFEIAYYAGGNVAVLYANFAGKGRLVVGYPASLPVACFMYRKYSLAPSRLDNMYIAGDTDVLEEIFSVNDVKTYLPYYLAIAGQIIVAGEVNGRMFVISPFGAGWVKKVSIDYLPGGETIIDL